LVKNGKVFLRDFDSTNGTFINDQPVKGEIELHHEDRLKVGPLSFLVRVEATPPVNKPTPVPPPAAPPAAQDDESIAAMLLSLQEDGEAKTPGAVGADGIPQGSTVMEIPAPLQEEANPEESKEAAAAKPGEKKKEPPQFGNTQSAAKAILEKYTRRQRG
jgi:pSer/pThr/pTyr-binding forkhead associated (FHA) protein